MKITFSNLNKINVEAFEDIFLLDNYLDIIELDCSNMNLKELPNDLIYLINLRNSIGKLAGKFDYALRCFETFINFSD